MITNAEKMRRNNEILKKLTQLNSVYVNYQLNKHPEYLQTDSLYINWQWFGLDPTVISTRDGEIICTTFYTTRGVNQTYLGIGYASWEKKPYNFRMCINNSFEERYSYTTNKPYTKGKRFHEMFERIFRIFNIYGDYHRNDIIKYSNRCTFESFMEEINTLIFKYL